MAFTKYLLFALIYQTLCVPSLAETVLAEKRIDVILFNESQTTSTHGLSMALKQQTIPGTKVKFVYPFLDLYEDVRQIVTNGTSPPGHRGAINRTGSRKNKDCLPARSSSAKNQKPQTAAPIKTLTLLKETQKTSPIKTPTFLKEAETTTPVEEKIRTKTSIAPTTNKTNPRKTALASNTVAIPTLTPISEKNVTIAEKPDLPSVEVEKETPPSPPPVKKEIQESIAGHKLSLDVDDYKDSEKATVTAELFDPQGKKITQGKLKKHGTLKWECETLDEDDELETKTCGAKNKLQVTIVRNFDDAESIGQNITVKGIFTPAKKDLAEDIHATIIVEACAKVTEDCEALKAAALADAVEEGQDQQPFSTGGGMPLTPPPLIDPSITIPRVFFTPATP